MDTKESQWRMKSSVRRGGCDGISQSWQASRLLQFTSVCNSFAQGTDHQSTPLSPNAALAGKSSSSSSAALNAYLAKYHQSGSSGQLQRLADGIESTGRQHRDCVADRQVLSTFLPPERTVHALPESPLSRFKEQAAQVAWKPADSREAGAENSDFSNISTGDRHQQRFPVTNPELKSSLNDTCILDNSVSSMNEEDPSLELLTSTSARAVLDRIREAKLLGRQPTKKTFALLAKVVCSQQQELLDMENQQGSDVRKKPVDERLGGDASNKEVDRGSDESLGDSQVEVLPVLLPPVSVTSRQIAASQQHLLETQDKPMIPSKLPSGIPSSDKREQPRRSKNKKEAANVSGEMILKVAKAALLIQRAWKTQRQERQQQHSMMIHGSDDCSRGDDIEVTYIIEPSEQSESHQSAFVLPRPAQIMLPQVNPNKANREKELSVDTSTAHSAIGMAGRDEGDTSNADQSTPTTEAAPHELIEALWMEDEWVCLEEGGYLGALEDAFSSQDPLSRKQNEANLLVWRHPQKLIERRESERIAWWQECKRAKRTMRMALSDAEHCGKLHIEVIPSSTTQTESEEVREPIAPSKIGNHVDLITTPKRNGLHIHLPKCRLARKKHRPGRVRIQVSCTRGGQRAKLAKTQVTSDAEVKQQSACDDQLSVNSAETVAHKAAFGVDRFVVFSSPRRNEETNGAVVDQRNDLISIDVLGVRSALSWGNSVANSESSRHGGSRDLDQASQNEICGFIPLHCVTMERVSSTTFSTSSSESSGSHQCSEGGVNSTKDANRDDVSASLYHISRDYDTRAVVSEDGGHFESQPQSEFETNTNENDDQEPQVVDEKRLTPEEDPSMAISQPSGLEKRHVAKAFGDEFANQQASEPAMKWMGRHRESDMQVDEMGETNGLRGRPVHRVDPAKKEEFRQILSEFKASLRQSVSASSSPSSLASSALFSASLNSTSNKPPYLLEDEPTQPDSHGGDDPEEIEDEEDDKLDEELQAMLQEINHFKQQFPITRRSNGAPA